MILVSIDATMLLHDNTTVDNLKEGAIITTEGKIDSKSSPYVLIPIFESIILVEKFGEPAD